MTGADILFLLIGLGLGVIGCLPSIALVAILERATRPLKNLP